MGRNELKAHQLQQEKTERFYLDKFLEALRLKPESVERGKNPPDFLVATDEGCVAIEETGFHSGKKGVDGSPRRSIEEEWLRLQRIFVQERKPYPDLDRISGFLFFKALETPPRREHGPFVSELLGFARKELGRITEEGMDFASFGSTFPLLGRYLKRLRLRDAGCYITWEWSNNADVVGLTQEELRRIISPKLKISRPIGVTGNWLLVVSGHQLSQDMGLPHVDVLREYGELNEALADGPYDRVYIFQYMFGRVLLWQPTQGWLEIKKAQFGNRGSLQ